MRVRVGMMRKMLQVLLAAALVALALIPLSAQADEVSDLLLSDAYVEGQAVVGLLDGEDGLTAQSEHPYAVEPLTEVSAASVQAPASGLTLAVQASQRVSIALVSSDELSTEELLRVLVDDPRVVFAEPNYLYSLASEEDVVEQDASASEAAQESTEQTAEDAATQESKNAATPEVENDAAPEAENVATQEVENDAAPELENVVAQEADNPVDQAVQDDTRPEAEERAEQATQDDASQGSALVPMAPATDGPIGDLNPLVWGNWSTDQTSLSETSAANPSINVPAYGSDQVGANMDKQIVVALLDTGVDYTNPDLVDVLYRFSPDEQAALGCWEWGYNAIGRGQNGNVPDQGSIDLGHGTHTAGTIGASWDGRGISGVASNVKIVSITLADSDGQEALADALCAFDFVRRFNEQAPEDGRIRVTSNSWSEYMSSRALNAVVRELGDTWGIVSFFSAGNDGKNNDYYEKTPSSMTSNPYAVVVANTTPAEALCASSEYGEATVDLAAPGTGILSTLCASKASYFPDASRETNLVYAGFDGDDNTTVTVSQLDADGVAHELSAEVVSNVHFFGTSCFSFDIDPAYVLGHRTWLDESEVYKVRLDFSLAAEDAQQFEGAEDLHFGAGFSCGSGFSARAPEASTNVTTKTVSGDGTSAEEACWGAYDYFLTHDDEGDETATRPADDVLSVTLTLNLHPGCTTVYLDSLGVGTQVVPYGFATGTSMATPQVAGAAAVLASQGYEGKELASLVRSKVRIPSGGSLPVKTGGIFDFTVAGSPDSAEEAPLAPVIAGVSVSGTTVVVTGENFGSAPGSVELGRYVAGASPTSVASSVVSWSDGEVTLALDDAFEGILRVVLTNPGGAHDTRYAFVSKSAGVYEQDLPLDTTTGDPFMYEEQGDWETKGPLVGLGCKLYYLPAYEGQHDSSPSFRRMYCFDLKTQTWSQLSDLPEWLQDVSAVMHEGKIVVEGATMYTESDVPHPEFPDDASPQERMYVYDPTTSTWSEASSEGMSLGQTIINDDGQLKLVGGSKPNPEHPDWEWMALPLPVMAYDLDAGAGEELCDLPEVLRNPQAAAHEGTILLYDAVQPRLVRVQNGQAAVLEGALPDFFLAEEGEVDIGAWGVVGHYAKRALLAPTTEGFVLVGPPSVGGASDTFVLRDGTDAFEPYQKRSSDDRVYAQAACTYRGRLFVIGSAWFEPEQRFFRATAMEVPEYPGDIPCDDDPSPEPTPDPGPTPKPEPTPTPAPTPGPAPASKPNAVLPQTDDPSVSTRTVTVLFAVGLAVVATGVALRLATRRQHP